MIIYLQNQLSNWIFVLQERSENIEDMVSELELTYNSVEVFSHWNLEFAFKRFDITLAKTNFPKYTWLFPCFVTQEQCKDSEKALDKQNEEVMKLVMERYNEMSQTMEEEKKAKLEQLYDQIVSFQENTESAKETMETTAKEMEETDDLVFLLVSVALLKLCFPLNCLFFHMPSHVQWTHQSLILFKHKWVEFNNIWMIFFILEPTPLTHPSTYTKLYPWTYGGSYGSPRVSIMSCTGNHHEFTEPFVC